jgi:hypothetical protein
MSDHLRSILDTSIKENSTTRNILKSVASAYYSVSEVSAQEAAYNVLQLRMVQSSVQTTFISTGPPDKRRRMLKSKAELERLDADSEDIYRSGPIEYYAARPDTLANINLAQFIAYYDYSKKSKVSIRRNHSAEDDGDADGDGDGDSDGDSDGGDVDNQDERGELVVDEGGGEETGLDPDHETTGVDQTNPTVSNV